MFVLMISKRKPRVSSVAYRTGWDAWDAAVIIELRPFGGDPDADENNVMIVYSHRDASAEIDELREKMFNWVSSI